MRTIFYENLNLKNNYSKNDFYKIYWENWKKGETIVDITHDLKPVKRYEIVKVIDMGKNIFLLDTNYISYNNKIGQNVYFDYDIACKIYKLLLQIKEITDAEIEENEALYENEKIELYERIQELENTDNELYINKCNLYNNVENSVMYDNYKKIIEENKSLKKQNDILKNELKMLQENVNLIKVKKKSLLQRIIAVFKGERNVK